MYPAEDLTDRDERFLAAEFIREKIFRLLGEEVPYATTVAIDKFEVEGALRRIYATVYVDKAGQRAILLGEGGARMKAIATQARAEMERLFGGKVFLEVWVRVKSGWADTDAVAHALRLLRAVAHMATRQPVQRRDDEPAFVLHAYPYRETSLIVEAFTPAMAASRSSRAAPSGRARRCAGCCRRSSRWRCRGRGPAN